MNDIFQINLKSVTKSFEGLDAPVLKNLNFHIAKAKENNQTFVLSNEFFSLFDAPQWSVGQLKELFPEGKIIIIIRRQQDIIKSVYKHQGREISVAPKKYRGLYVSFNEYFDYLSRLSQEKQIMDNLNFSG